MNKVTVLVKETRKKNWAKNFFIVSSVSARKLKCSGSVRAGKFQLKLITNTYLIHTLFPRPTTPWGIASTQSTLCHSLLLVHFSCSTWCWVFSVGMHFNYITHNCIIILVSVGPWSFYLESFNLIDFIRKVDVLRVCPMTRETRYFQITTTFKACKYYPLSVSIVFHNFSQLSLNIEVSQI